MRKVTLSLLAVLVLASAALAQASSQITLWNKTADPLSLVVDGAFQCTSAPEGGKCTATVSNGDHHFVAQNADGTASQTSDHSVGGNQTWEICKAEDSDANGVCKN